nr:MAG TPA: hypothetical protein [Caudoviricetes sp.]
MWSPYISTRYCAACLTFAGISILPQIYNIFLI